MVPLKNIPPGRFREALQKIVTGTKVPLYDNISEDPSVYDEEISCGVMKNDKVTSLILFEKDSDQEYHLVLLSSLSANAAVELRDMLMYSSIKFHLGTPDDAYVRVLLGSERSIDLFSFFFPDKKLPLIRRGFYS